VFTEYHSSANASWLWKAVTECVHQIVLYSNCTKVAHCNDVTKCLSHHQKKSTTMEQVSKKGKTLTSANFMTVRNSALCLKRPVEDITSDVEQCRFLALA
jgi:hypothetical protein